MMYVNEQNRKVRTWIRAKFNSWQDAIEGRTTWVKFVEDVGVDYDSCEKWRNDGSPPTNGAVVRLANYFNDPEIYDILGWDRPKCF